MRLSDRKFAFMLLLQFHRTVIYLTFVFSFFFTSTLADTLRSMDVSHSPDLLTLYSPFPVSRATGSCTCMFPFLSHVFSYLYEYELSTRHWLLVCFPFLLLSHRLVHLRFSLMPFSFRLVNSSMLTFTAYAFPFVVCRLVSRLVILRL